MPDYVGRRWKPGGLVIVGQDPGVATRSRVRTVLMLDNRGCALSKYIERDILGPVGLDVNRICAINLVPDNPGASLYVQSARSGVPFYDLVTSLAKDTWPSFEMKMRTYQPGFILTLGKPVFLALNSILNLNLKWNPEVVGKITPIRIADRSLGWIPCVHIRTYRRHEYYRREQPSRLRQIAEIVRQTR